MLQNVGGGSEGEYKLLQRDKGSCPIKCLLEKKLPMKRICLMQHRFYNVICKWKDYWNREKKCKIVSGTIAELLKVSRDMLIIVSVQCDK